MAMGRRKREQQGELFIATQDLCQPKGHIFYDKLNRFLAEEGFDAFVEAACLSYYKEAGPGRPSIPPGTYFRMLFIGYFEGIDSQRGIAWRCADSLSLRAFLGVTLSEQTPDHSTLSTTRERLPHEVHEKVFQFILKVAGIKNLLGGKTVGVDSTYLEANAAMKSIVRKDSGEDYQAFLKRLAQAEGLENPTAEDLQRFDRNRKGKKCSNEEWSSKTDPDSEIIKMKDGRTHLAYKAEHVVDLESTMVLSAEITRATHGDAETIVDSLINAQVQLDSAATLTPEPGARRQSTQLAEAEARLGAGEQIEEAAADKGYHKASTMETMTGLGFRSYIPERKSKHKARWTDKPAEQKQAVYANRRRVGRNKSKKMQRERSEKVERTFAHVCETGGARRTWLRGLEKVRKRYLIQVAGHNLGVLMRKLFGTGKPRCLQGAPKGALGVLARLIMVICGLWAIGRALTSRWRQKEGTFLRPRESNRAV